MFKQYFFDSAFENTNIVKLAYHSITPVANQSEARGHQSNWLSMTIKGNSDVTELSEA